MCKLITLQEARISSLLKKFPPHPLAGQSSRQERGSIGYFVDVVSIPSSWSRLPGTDSRSRCQVLGRRELLHLDADFGQDTLSRSFADARNTDQEGDGLLPAQPRLGGRLLSALLRDGGGSVYCSGSSGEASGISRRIRWSANGWF
jgi:hypothetical protein